MLFLILLQIMPRATARPKGPEETKLQWIYLGFEEDDAAMRALRLAQANLSGPTGYLSMRLELERLNADYVCCRRVVRWPDSFTEGCSQQSPRPSITRPGCRWG